MHPTKYFLAVIVAACLLAFPAAQVLAQQPPPAEGNESDLIAVLGSDAPLFDKAKACQRLAVIGTKQAVPVLAKLLADEKLSHYARTGLEPIADPSADDALREAMGKLQGRLLVGVINSIGIRRDAKAVDGLKGLLKSSHSEVAAAAAAALGRIATPEAVQILRDSLAGPASLRPAVADACLTAADVLLSQDKQAEAAAICDALRQADLAEHLKIAALHGAIRARGSAGLPLLVECLRSEDKALFRVALRMAQELPGDDVTRALIEEFPKLGPPPGEYAEPLMIVKAEYGAKDKWVDVTNKLAVAAWGNRLSVTAGNHLAGDPIHGVAKQLRVDYVLDGQEHTVEVTEGEVLQIQGDKEAPYPRQALVIYVLGNRGDRAALPVVLEAAKSGPAEIRMAAVRVLANLPSVSAVPVLLETALEGQALLAEAARDSLAELPGEEVDAALSAMLDQSQAGRLLIVIELTGRRGIASAVPVLLKLADSGDQQVRTAAIGALGLTVGLGELPSLIDRLVKPKTPDVAPAAKEALRKACLRMPDRDACAARLTDRMAGAPTAAKADLLELLGVVGGAKALQGVSAAAKDADEEVQDVATRVLGEWMSPDAAPVLLELAKTEGAKFKVRSLRGYIRIARQLDVPANERIAMCREALAVAGRDDEKKLALEALVRYPSPQTLAFVAEHLDNAALKEVAGASAVAIAEKIVRTHPAAVAEAMKKASQATGNSELAGRAKALLRRASAKLRKN